MRAIPQQCVELVKRFEGLRLSAYLCPADVWTIGYGHTGDVLPWQKVTEEEAEDLLREDLKVFGEWVSKWITVPLNDNQFSALVSFAFNLGPSRVRHSTLRRKLNEGDYASVPSELAKWNRGGGKILPGLVKRRQAEADLWCKEE